ncbi:MAG: hypothetical protein JKY26_06740 [Pseudomonas sp.]|nr:hypothetical protein [Pseudomonas sp.]
MAKRIKTELVVEGKNNASRALKQADSQLLGISSAAKKAGAALLGTFSVVAIGAWVKQSINAADEARKLAQAAGLTTEAFTGLQFAAAQSGVSTTDLSGALTRLSRSMSDAATIGGRPAEVFAQLGVSVLNAEGGLRSADEVLSELAERFQSMPDGVAKTAAAVELLGRSGAKLIPLLNGGAEGIEALTKQAERLGLIVTDEQAAASERFNDNIAALGGASRGAANTMAAELLPTLNLMSGLLLDVAENSETASVFATLLGGTLKILATAALVAGSQVKFVGEGLAVLAVAAVALLRGDLDAAANVISDFGDRVEENYRTTFERINKIWSGGYEELGASAGETVKTMRELQEASLAAAEESNKALAASYKKMVSTAETELKNLARTEQQVQKEIEDIRKKRLDIERDYAEAIAGFGRTGKAEPSYNQAQDLKLAAREALRAGDIEQAAKLARESLKVLQDVSDAGGNTYGFAGFAKELQAIEIEASKLEESRAEEKVAAIRAEIADLSKQLKEVTDVDIDLELTDAVKQKLLKDVQALGKLLGEEMVIPVVLEAPAAPTRSGGTTGTSGSWAGGATAGYASGGRISGPGSGTSDSILARLSNGEYVIKAAAVRKYGVNLLDNINGMRLPGHAEGGMIGAATAGAGPGTPLNLTIDGKSYSLSGSSDTISELAKAIQIQKLKRR